MFPLLADSPYFWGHASCTMISGITWPLGISNFANDTDTQAFSKPQWHACRWRPWKVQLTIDHWYPGSKVRGANMGPNWVLSVPDGPHVGPINLAINRWIFVECKNTTPRTWCCCWAYFNILFFAELLFVEKSNLLNSSFCLSNHYIPHMLKNGNF